MYWACVPFFRIRSSMTTPITRLVKCNEPHRDTSQENECYYVGVMGSPLQRQSLTLKSSSRDLNGQAELHGSIDCAFARRLFVPYLFQHPLK